MFVKIVFPVVVVFVMLVWGGGAFLNFRFLVLLKERHSAKWNELGRPGYFWNKTMGGTIRFWGFLLRREYARLEDPDLTTLGDALLTANVLLVFGIIAAGSLMSSYFR